VAHAPLRLPLTLLRVHTVSPTQVELEELLRRHSPAAVHLLPTHLVHVPVNPIHAELENILHAGALATSHASGIPFDLSFRDYPEAQHEKLTSIVVLLLHSEKLDKSGDFKRRDQVNDKARALLYSLGKQTVLKVAKDAQFLQLHVLKHIFQIDP